MPRKTVPASEAARQLGISLDTLRRWDRQGRIRTERDRRNRRLVPASEIDRLRGGPEQHDLSARNRFRGRIREVRIEGLLAQVEVDVVEPTRVVAVITREAAEQLGLAARPGRDRARQGDLRDGRAVRRFAWLLVARAPVGRRLRRRRRRGGADDFEGSPSSRRRPSPRSSRRSRPTRRSTSPAPTSSRPRSAEGAPADVYAAASPKLPRRAVRGGPRRRAADLRHQSARRDRAAPTTRPGSSPWTTWPRRA